MYMQLFFWHGMLMSNTPLFVRLFFLSFFFMHASAFVRLHTHTQIHTCTSRRMVYRARVLPFFLNPALCASFHLLVSAAFSQRENLCLHGLCPQLHGEFYFCQCSVVLATSCEHPCSKSCSCRMYSFIFIFTFPIGKKQKIVF